MHPLSTVLFLAGYGLALPLAGRIATIVGNQQRLAFAGHQVGVLIGPDLLVRDGRVVTDALAHPSRDRTLHGYRTWVKKEPEAARAAADRVIRNTYRTLMSRGMRGCAVFSEDADTRDWFRRALSETDQV